jgi:pimeloyl-ACP methyl ester carboxylesterase
MYDVGGHELYLHCEGTGSPTVVYLHGFIFNSSGGGSTNAGELPTLLGDEHQVCVYDRANVGQSDQVPGPLTGKDSVEDLHALMGAADLPRPVMLLGASWGGLLASMYAATYPDDVAGMVLLDPQLPTGNELDRFLPPEQRLAEGAWKDNLEQVDQYVTCEEALALLQGQQQFPVSFIATEKLDIDPALPVEAMTKAIREDQAKLMSHYPQGEITTVDAPHYMEPVIPERIEEEVEKVAARIS